MVTKALYLLGGAGTGKSTFMAQLLDDMGYTHGPLEDIHATIGGHGRAVTLRGHPIRNQDSQGLYLGVLRDGPFPGTDALERVSHGPATAWLRSCVLPEVIVGEGATLAVRPFMCALHETTDLQVLAFHCDPWVHELRLLERGTGQAESFVTSSITRTNNLAKLLEAQGGKVHWVDSGDHRAWQAALELAGSHLQQFI